ncbi:MAG TPA: DNA gyrase subunit A [Planctomycetota bacterium]|nr:DNA gyrase subunit A [Planctomycetota bacterium]
MTETPPTSKPSYPQILLEKEMQESYLNYSMSVILSRALPDVRDGLKPSQRRILVAMDDLNLGPRAKYRKCAKICGDTSGNYHPHGESVIYPTLVGMAQPFTMRYPLVDSQGNFGAIDGSPPAAMRYTEARMAMPTVHLLEDRDQDTVDVQPNYDGKILNEPVVLPGRFPNLLCNGTTGIAVGMATSLPPHNLKEIANALYKLLDNPDVTLDELLQEVPGPDFPTGGIIMGRSGIRNAYVTGRGSVTVRAKYHVEEKNKRKYIVFTEVPYQVRTVTILERIAHLAKTDQLDTIADCNDETNSRVGLRLVVELKRGVDDETVTVNNLFKLTPLQTRFSIINLAIDRGQPRTFGFKALLEAYRDHRVDVIIRRSRFQLRKAEERLHILEGLRIAVQNIDAVVEIIKTSANPEDARQRLIDRFSLSETQARAILDMRLARLTGLEIEKLEAEYEEVKTNIAWLQRVLSEPKLRFDIIRKEMEEMVAMYGDERRTVISDEEVGDFVAEDLIAEEMMVVTVSHEGYVKRTALDQYRSQNRGGKGVAGAETKEGDFIEHLFVASTHDYILFFSDRGRVYWRKVYELPLFGRQAKGRALANVLEMQPGERLNTVLRVDTFEGERFLITATRKGLIKKTELAAYGRPREKGIIAVSLEEDDSLIGVGICKPGDTIVLGTAKGMAIRFAESDARAMGRQAYGVRGIKLTGDDQVVGMAIPQEGHSILTVCEKGYGKRTALSEYRLQGRGGQGLIDIKTTERNGRAVGLLAVADGDDIMMITRLGQIVRTPASQISLIGRNTQGVRCISFKTEGDSLVSFTMVPREDA